MSGQSESPRKILADVHIGITPTCWRNADFPGLTEKSRGVQNYSAEECLQEIVEAKFTGCSDDTGYGSDRGFPEGSDEWEKLLKKVGAPSPFYITEPWISTWFTTAGGRERTLNEYEKHKARWLKRGVQNIGVAEFGNSVHLDPKTPLDQRSHFSDQEWNELIDGLNELGEKAAADGFRICYHPHMGTGVQTQPEMDRLMAGTNADHVHLLLDTGHLTWAGGNAVAAVHRHGERIKHLHIKDLRKEKMEAMDLATTSFRSAVGGGIFNVPGFDTGVVDFVQVLHALDDIDYARPDRWKKTGNPPSPNEKWRKWLVVEAEQPATGGFHEKSSPKEYATHAFSTLEKILKGEKSSGGGTT